MTTQYLMASVYSADWSHSLCLRSSVSPTRDVSTSMWTCSICVKRKCGWVLSPSTFFRWEPSRKSSSVNACHSCRGWGDGSSASLLLSRKRRSRAERKTPLVHRVLPHHLVLSLDQSLFATVPILVPCPLGFVVRLFHTRITWGHLLTVAHGVPAKPKTLI